MPTTPDQYYKNLSQDYESKIRQLVPAYDDMVDWIVDLVAWSEPGRVLDIGCGDAALTSRLLDRLPGARAVAVEASAGMITVAGRIAARYPDRLELVQTDILEYGPGEPLDAICTNLVLHNIPPGPKGELLRRLNDWLVPGGVFVWGDLVRQPDATLEARMVAFRERFARDHGCDEALVEENFRKEGTTDHPLTVPDMVRALAAAGFRAPAPVWAHDTFAIVRARRPPSTP